MRPVPRLSVTRRDAAGEFLEGDGTEDTLLDENGDNTGDAGDEYRGSDRFGTTAAERSQGDSLDQRLADEEPDAVDDDGGEGSYSRTDPDLVGPDQRGMGLSAEEAALHEVDPADTTD